MEPLTSEVFGSADPSAIPTPLAESRIIDLFIARKWTYFRDNDGDLGGHWPLARYYFIVTGERRDLLYIRGLSGRTYRSDDVALIREQIAEWHRARLWPKLMVRMDDDGSIHVQSDYTVDCEQGLTDEQLATHIDCALQTTADFLRTLDDILDSRD